MHMHMYIYVYVCMYVCMYVHIHNTKLRLDPLCSPASSSSSASPPSASSAAAAVAPRSSVFTSFSDLSKIMGFNTPTNKKRKGPSAALLLLYCCFTAVLTRRIFNPLQPQPPLLPLQSRKAK